MHSEFSCRDKKKEFAPNCAAYYPFGVDVFLCQQKIDHIARFVELPSVNSSGKFPSVLVVNVQVLIQFEVCFDPQHTVKKNYDNELQLLITTAS